MMTDGRRGNEGPLRVRQRVAVLVACFALLVSSGVLAVRAASASARDSRSVDVITTERAVFITPTAVEAAPVATPTAPEPAQRPAQVTEARPVPESDSVSHDDSTDQLDEADSDLDDSEEDSQDHETVTPEVRDDDADDAPDDGVQNGDSDHESD